MRRAERTTYAGYGQIQPLYGAATTGPSTGKYQGPGGYVYGYYAPTGEMRILIEPAGASNRTVKTDSVAYKAILAQINSGVAKAIDATTYTALKASAGSTSSSSSTVTTAEEKPSVAARSWFPVAVVGTLVVLGGIGIAVARRR